MRILHIMLSNYYVENQGYQENRLTYYNKSHGHIVKILASSSVYNDYKNISYKSSTDYNEHNIEVVRLPVKKYIPFKNKIRAHKGTRREIEVFRPEIIVFHGIQGWDLINASMYVKKNKNTILYVDVHSDYNNSSRKIFSKYILHKIFYKKIIKKCIPYINKILCISPESQIFAINEYGIDKSKTEIFPLGGDILDDQTYFAYRKETRAMFSLKDEIVYIHTGKMSILERKTHDVINAFNDLSEKNSVLFLVGKFEPEQAEYFYTLMKRNTRIIYLGWKNQEELIKLLCASDVYVNIGGMTATTQSALCNRCSAIVYPHENYIKLIDKNGFFASNHDELLTIMSNLTMNSLAEMSNKSLEIARNYLDYSKLASRLES